MGHWRHYLLRFEGNQLTVLCSSWHEQLASILMKRVGQGLLRLGIGARGKQCKRYAGADLMCFVLMIRLRHPAL